MLPSVIIGSLWFWSAKHPVCAAYPRGCKESQFQRHWEHHCNEGSPWYEPLKAYWYVIWFGI